MSIRIPAGEGRSLFQGPPAIVPQRERGDRDSTALDLAHKVDSAMERFLARSGAADAGQGGGGVPWRPDADFLRSVLAGAPDDDTRAEAEEHLSASVGAFALEHEALEAQKREARREETLRRRQADVAGHITRLTGILSGNPKPELRKATAEAVLAQLQSLGKARTALRGEAGDFSANTQRGTA